MPPKPQNRNSASVRGSTANKNIVKSKVDPKKSHEEKPKQSSPAKLLEDKSLEEMLADDDDEKKEEEASNSESNDAIQSSQVEQSLSQMTPGGSKAIADKFEELFDSHLKNQFTPSNKNEAEAQRCANENVRALLPMMGEFFYGVITKAITDTMKIAGSLNAAVTQLDEDVKKIAAQADQAENTAYASILKTDRFDQRDRSKNIRIVGLPEKPEEDTCQEVINFASSLNVTFTRDDIENVYRVDRKPVGTQTAPNNQPPKPRPIFVCFRSDPLRKKLFDAKKLIPAKYPNMNIFVCDDLTPARAKMLEKARNVPGKTAFSNGTDGSILVYPKRAPNSRSSNTRTSPIVLKEPRDLLKLPDMSASDVEEIYEIMEKT